MSKQAMQQALEALENKQYEPWDTVRIPAIAALKEAIKQPADVYEQFEGRVVDLAKWYTDNPNTDDIEESLRFLVADAITSAPTIPAGWQPIESASRQPWDFVLLAWGPEEDKATGLGCFRDGKWVSAAVFFCMNKPHDDAWEFRETEVQPTHWMHRPAAPKGETA